MTKQKTTKIKISIATKIAANRLKAEIISDDFSFERAAVLKKKLEITLQ